MSDTYLLSAAEIDAMAGLDKAHFLNPHARRNNKSLGDATGLTGIGVHLIQVQPGDETTEYHVHHYEDECVYVLSGTATSVIDERREPIGPGDFIGYRKRGLAHTIENTGDVPLRLLVIGERLDHDVGDYPRLGKRIFRHRGLPANLVDHAALEEPVFGARPEGERAMTNAAAIGIALAIAAFLAVDALVLGWDLSLNLARRFVLVLEWAAFWR